VCVCACVCVYIYGILIIIQGQFQVFQRFLGSTRVSKTVESCFAALKYYEKGSTCVCICFSVSITSFCLICSKYVCMHAAQHCAHVCMHACVYVCMYVCMYQLSPWLTKVSTYIDTYIDTYIHTYIHTYISAGVPVLEETRRLKFVRTHTDTFLCLDES
jgi:hypothetical protein